jgi:predicted Zn finger-like uncharacterized protein
MKTDLSRKEIEEKIKEVFSGTPSPKEVKKVKILAMSKNVKLKDHKKLFCKKCYAFFNSENSQMRIKNGKKIIKCKSCGHIIRWQIKKQSG